jgi:hypothetical protein
MVRVQVGQDDASYLVRVNAEPAHGYHRRGAAIDQEAVLPALKASPQPSTFTRMAPGGEQLGNAWGSVAPRRAWVAEWPHDKSRSSPVA